MSLPILSFSDLSIVESNIDGEEVLYDAFKIGSSVQDVLDSICITAPRVADISSSSDDSDTDIVYEKSGKSLDKLSIQSIDCVKKSKALRIFGFTSDTAQYMQALDLEEEQTCESRKNSILSKSFSKPLEVKIDVKEPKILTTNRLHQLKFSSESSILYEDIVDIAENYYREQDLDEKYAELSFKHSVDDVTNGNFRLSNRGQPFNLNDAILQLLKEENQNKSELCKVESDGEHIEQHELSCNNRKQFLGD